MSLDDAEQTIDSGTGSSDAYAELPAPKHGEFVGRYVLLDPVGRGSMGVVYSAYDPELDRKLAIKVLRARSDSGRKRLLREAQAMARVTHPNVVAVHDVGEHAGRVFIAMEFVHGETLSQWMKRSHGWRASLSTLLAAGEGLAAAHAEGLVHRDFKPDNVMIGRDGRVRVLDLGLVRPTGDTSHPADGSGPRSAEEELVPKENLFDVEMTQAGALLGTPAYMAPEQYAGATVDERTDQFAFCVVLFEAVYGVRPFTGTQPAVLARKISEGAVEWPRPEGVPRFFRHVLERGLSVDPAKRYPSLRELLETLRRKSSRIGFKVGIGLGAFGLLAVSSFTLLQYQSVRQVAGCERAAAAIEEDWNDEARSSLRAALADAPAGESLATNLEAKVDTFATEWSDARVAGCMSGHARGPLPPQLAERSAECLADQREALDGVLGAFDHMNDAAGYATVADALPSPAECLQAERLSKRPAPPSDPDLRVAIAEAKRRLMIAHALNAAAQHARAAEIVDALRKDDVLEAWPELEAHAALERGVAFAQLEQSEVALPELQTAVDASIEAGDDDLTALACTNLAQWLLAQNEADAAARWLRLAEAHAHRTPPRTETRLQMLAVQQALRSASGDGEGALQTADERVELATNTHGGQSAAAIAARIARAQVLIAFGRSGDAKTELADELEHAQAVYGDTHPEIAKLHEALGDIASDMDERDVARRHFVRAKAIVDEISGPASTPSLELARRLGHVERREGNMDEAVRIFEAALQAYEAGPGDDDASIPDLLWGLGRIANIRQQPDVARNYLERAVASSSRLYGEDTYQTAEYRLELAESLGMAGDMDASRAELDRARQAIESKPGVDDKELARVHMLIGKIEGRYGDADRGIDELQKALRLATAAHAQVRGLAAMSGLLAEALWSRGRKKEALEVARQAAAAAARDPKTTAATLEFGKRWIAEHEAMLAAE